MVNTVTYVKQNTRLSGNYFELPIPYSGVEYKTPDKCGCGIGDAIEKEEFLRALSKYPIFAIYGARDGIMFDLGTQAILVGIENRKVHILVDINGDVPRCIKRMVMKSSLINNSTIIDMVFDDDHQTSVVIKPMLKTTPSIETRSY